MTKRLAVICEAEADFRTGCGLADRVICEKVDWIEAKVIDSYRAWCGMGESHMLTWAFADAEADRRGIRAHGFFDGVPGGPDSKTARKVMLLLFAQDPIPDAIVLLRDDDRQTERRKGLEQAREDIQRRRPIPIVIGLAHLNREAWEQEDGEAVAVVVKPSPPPA